MCESATHVVTYRMHDAKRVASIDSMDFDCYSEFEMDERAGAGRQIDSIVPSYS